MRNNQAIHRAGHVRTVIYAAGLLLALAYSSFSSAAVTASLTPTLTPVNWDNTERLLHAKVSDTGNGARLYLYPLLSDSPGLPTTQMYGTLDPGTYHFKFMVKVPDPSQTEIRVTWADFNGNYDTQTVSSATIDSANKWYQIDETVNFTANFNNKWKGRVAITLIQKTLGSGIPAEAYFDEIFLVKDGVHYLKSALCILILAIPTKPALQPSTSRHPRTTWST